VVSWQRMGREKNVRPWLLIGSGRTQRPQWIQAAVYVIGGRCFGVKLTQRPQQRALVQVLYGA